MEEGKELYKYNPSKKVLTSVSLHLPECHITRDSIKVGSSVFIGNAVSGAPVGLIVTSEGVGMGASMPPGLAKLVI